MSTKILRKYFTRKNLRKVRVIKLQRSEWKRRPSQITEVLDDGISYFKSQGYSTTENDKTSVLSLLEYLKKHGVEKDNKH